MSAIISFKKYRIVEYNFKRIDPTEETDELNEKPEFELEVIPGINDEWTVGKLELKVTYKNAEVEIFLIVEGYFTISKDLDRSEVPQVLTLNGTAILFPYVRSMVSMVSSLDSENAILLPTINTYDLINDSENE